jgi:branched-chain amino acid aminotransferase
LFLRRGGRLVTPPVSDGALPGVMRAVLIECCGAEERTLFPADVQAADITFLCNSLGLRAVAALEGDLLRCDAADLAALVTTVAATDCGPSAPPESRIAEPTGASLRSG